ncbi:hypothetical protein [Nannocystis sp.]|uniref:hypothetical protein n=1 Tax=Nannocystis sp. TaxID=1962667 RepID=UPI0025EDB92C|nr:hypothetical protein [Nannocystis sp.]MBK7830271.1 hypothetical protein [Nannocystis sp.]
MRVTTAALGLMIVACSRPSPPLASPPAPPTIVEPPVESAELRAPDVIEELAARGVYHDDFARAELYTWTTAEQVTALRRDRRLLVAEGGAGMGPSPYLRGLTAVAERGGAGRELAALLLEHPALRRRRYAWTSPFATTMGLGPVRYGDALIRVELAPRALLLRFRPGDAEPFVAVDLRGAAVPIAELLADPGRLGAVYHVRDGPRDELPFREYVLCNEAMVLAWSVATPEIRAQVDADIDLLTRLAAGPLAALPESALRSSSAPAWVSARAGALPLDHWQASLAFDNLRYRPSSGNIAAIVATLRGYDGRGDPLTQGGMIPAAADQGAQASQTSR